MTNPRIQRNESFARKITRLAGHFNTAFSSGGLGKPMARALTRHTATSIACLFATAGAADTPRPDDHAPIAVMADHAHDEGEWMISYRTMHMQMAGNRDGTDSVSTHEILRSGSGRYMVAPTDMAMTMHMLGVMHAPSDRVTLMAMAPWLDMSMDHVTARGGAFETTSNGLGDVSLSAILSLTGEVVVSLGAALPTGSLNRQDITPMGNTTLPYPMQLGSGTVDGLASITLNRRLDTHSFGGQAGIRLPFGENDKGYSFAPSIDLSAWHAWRIGDRVSVSLRGRYEYRGNIDGADPRYAMALENDLVPTVDPARRGGSRLELGLGANLVLEQHRLGIEALAPLYRNLDGPQLETDWTVVFGWQYMVE